MAQADGKTPACIMAVFLPPDAPIVFGAPLQPVTLGTLLLLERWQSPLTGEAWRGMSEIEIARAWIILTDINKARASDLAFPVVRNGDLAELSVGLVIMRRHIETAFATKLPMGRKDSKTISNNGGGFPWWLPMVALAMERFGMTQEQAIWQTPLGQLFALASASAWNHGLEPMGETYEDREMNRILALPRLTKD